MTTASKILLIVLLGCALAPAQQHELAILAGGQFPVNEPFDFDPGFVLQGNYSGRMASVPFLALYAELPLVAGFELSRRLPQEVGERNYTSLFFTPGLKLKFAPGAPLSPWVSAGVGFARYNPEGLSATTTGVAQFGGGVDMRVAPFISLRGEVRDFYSGRPTLDVNQLGGRQHNVMVAGGLVLRF